MVHPIGALDIEGIKNALAPIQPTGWTSIASSIENGVADLSAFNGEKDLNILYIVTDGIETCGGSATEVAEKLKNENTNIVPGIIGFNVDANQNKILSEIAAAGGGYYANANDAAKLTSELQTLHELAYSNYNWETLDVITFSKIKRYHSSGLMYNQAVVLGEPLKEYNELIEVMGMAVYTGDDIEEGLFKYGGRVSKRLQEMAEERIEKIDSILKEEYDKRVEQSEQYLQSVESRKGATVARIPSTSRFDKESEY